MKLSPKKSKFLIIIIGILLILSLNFFQKEVKNFFYFISSPIQKVLWGAGDRTSDFFETIAEIKNLKKENEGLRAENQRLLAENLKLLELREENEALRTALEIDLKKDFGFVLAEVTGKIPQEDSILINKGSQDGISENLPVITYQKTVLGKIDEVYKNFSRVMLISNKESVFNGKTARATQTETDNGHSPPNFGWESNGVQGVQGVQGVVRGQGGSRVIFDLMARELEVKEGDLILTTGFEGIFPKGLLVGQVKKVEKNDVAPFQKAEIEMAFNIKDLDTVFILTDF